MNKKTIVRHSKDQLKLDFTVFPPVPLKENTNISESTFSLVKQKTFGRILTASRVSLKIIKFFFNTRNKDENRNLLREFDAVLSIPGRAKFEAVKVYKEYQEELKFGRFYQKLLSPIKIIIFSLLLIFMFLFSILLLPLFFISIFWKLAFGNREATGYYVKNDDSKPSIFINIDKCGEGSLSVEATISHEHIHLLQERYGYEEFGALNVLGYKRFASKLINVSSKNKRSLLYLLHEDEVEARLHELILSFYRSRHELPVTHKEIVGMVLSFNEIRKVVKALCENGFLNEYLPTNSNLLVDSRDGYAELDISIILLFLKGDLVEKYLLEVIPIMYAKILFYYGAHEESKELYKSIEDKSFYLSLYPRVDETK